jgi:tRNA A37 threonylcarbamoyladenosine modification protein TsaB
MGLVLAIEASSRTYAVAAGAGDSPAALRRSHRGDPDWAGIGDLAARTLAVLNARFRDVETIAVDVGPGGLSSIRAAVAYANGLAFSLGVKVFPVSSLELMGIAADEASADPLLSLKRGPGETVYAGMYANGEMIQMRYGPIGAIVPEMAGGLATVRLAGMPADAVADLVPEVTVTDTAIREADVAVLYVTARAGARDPERTADIVTALNEGSPIFHSSDISSLVSTYQESFPPSPVSVPSALLPGKGLVGGHVSQWVGVHGIGQQYESRCEILQDWKPALIGGLEAANDRRPVNPPTFDLAFYGDLFRPDPGDGGKGAIEDDPMAQLAGLDADELAELTETVEEIVTPADLASAKAEADSGKGVRVSVDLGLPASVVYLIGAVERRFPPGSGVLFLGDLRQVRTYLRNPDVKAEIDHITAAAAADADVLIGHSLGSVVAYEFLRQHPGHSVRLLLTLGSPLGLRMVRKRLPPGDPGDADWVNVRDRRDPVAAGGPLRDWYPNAADHLVVNGSEAHAAKRYLNSKACGKALLDAVPGLRG